MFNNIVIPGSGTLWGFILALFPVALVRNLNVL